MQKICPLTNLPFEVSTEEMALRKKLGVEGEPEYHPVFRFMQLGAFWQHWNLFKRKCDRAGKSIISVFSEDCPYPVWHKDEWIKHADPPGADFDPSRPVFGQMWDFFRKSPISHNIGAGNENCEYTDDWWYSKNCYLCHSGVNCQDLRYCYRTLDLKNCQFCVFSFDSELCIDLINSQQCFRVMFAYNAFRCSESAFLYDCRNCNHCMFCSNLRSKSFCFENQQLTENEYEKKVKEWKLSSRSVYFSAKKEFKKMLTERAWHRALFTEQCENVSGNYLYQCKNCQDCFFVTNDAEDCIHLIRAGLHVRDNLDCFTSMSSEIVYLSALVQDQCYDVRFSYNVVQCKFINYCAHCFQCENCFGCCGLVGKKYQIFNKPYSPEEFVKLKIKIIDHMQSTGEYGKFFPGYFAANPYDESISGFYWPLDKETAGRFGFRLSGRIPVRPVNALDSSEIPDNSSEANEKLTEKVFWDEAAGHPFQIQDADIVFSRDLGIPLPYTYYARRLQENFRLIPFDGMMRIVRCGKCGKETETSWTEGYDGRILCENCYLKEVY